MGRAVASGRRGGLVDRRGQQATSSTTVGSASRRTTLAHRTRASGEGLRSAFMTVLAGRSPPLAPCYLPTPPMAQPNPLYDLMLMLDTAAPEEQRQKILSDAEALILRGGEIVNKQDWGVRTMAFEIRHKTDAEYHLLQFHASAEVLATLHRTLRITDGIVRFRIIKLAPGTPAAPEQRPDRPAAEAEPAAY
jgi:small subunit ribosomal protein S6